MRKRTFFLLPLFFFLLSCQISEEDRINQTLNQRQEALQKRDISLYLSSISESYQDKNEDYFGLQNRMTGYFKNFDQIRYRFWDRTIYFEGEEARIVQQFQLEVEKNGKQNDYSGTEAIFLKKEGKQWKIVRGL
jgi:ketosteroid isomerase-like protein